LIPSFYLDQKPFNFEEIFGIEARMSQVEFIDEDGHEITFLQDE
jgi:hypothetical protein